MREKDVQIQLVQGLSARSAANFVKTASSFSSDVKIGKNGQFVDAKSILGVMSMAFAKGEQITLRVDGSDEEAALDSLVSLLESNE
ncbi:HPr family phosphocarrier protein [Alicyclobacillus tolerans]|uniref:Catabolite repression HPr-like protein/phosphocarrier protein n=2 Tax=Alicyclobacillus tolerans TaxID=90970 RepID=A0A1M6KDY9_9BACL|nr:MULTISPECIES: HPr family phosphocarrier protein [Alicyclobacillus]MDP9727238.1 catabolite repression HPr-like protein/phosphocarrier protein [Alicyclobacillus tengchongensis]QRF22998.1 HPr family phosphocarrier protein [Alicyclobacillus sp. TC]SHJ57173.1 catabolite repression HPr-like protein/phosphocarrier protein [Alicyclobacillus montanus]